MSRTSLSLDGFDTSSLRPASFPVTILMFSSSPFSLLPPVTFEDGADVFPDGDAAAAVELAEGQLHVEERDTAEHRHQQVGQQEGTWDGDMWQPERGREGGRERGNNKRGGGKRKKM